MYREGIKLAPIYLRIAAYVIDIFLVALICNVLFSDSQSKAIENAQKTVQRIYKMDMENVKVRGVDSSEDNLAKIASIQQELDDALKALLMYVATVTLLQIIYNFFFLYRYGASLGQIILRIRVVDVRSFDKPSLHICMSRSICKFLLVYISFVFAFFDRFARTLHDRMNRTIVIAN